MDLQRRPRRAGRAGREDLGAEVRRVRAPAHLRAAGHERLDVQGAGGQEAAPARPVRDGPRRQAGGRHEPLGPRLRRRRVRRLQHLHHHRRLRALRPDAPEQRAVERRAAAEPEDRRADGDEPSARPGDGGGRRASGHRLRAGRVGAAEPGRGRQPRVGRRVRLVRRRDHARVHRPEGRSGGDLLHAAHADRLRPARPSSPRCFTSRSSATKDGHRDGRARRPADQG